MHKGGVVRSNLNGLETPMNAQKTGHGIFERRIVWS